MSQFQVSADDSQVQAMLARAARRLNKTTLPFDHVLSHVGDGLTGRLAGYRLKNTLVLCTDPSGETRIAVA
jgi:hypothetical protein